MEMPSIGTIGSIALLGGLGYVVYKFYKGDWKLPSLADLFITPLPGEPEQTITETGVPGAVGDVIYNLFSGDNSLRTRVNEPDAQQQTVQEYYNVMPPDAPQPTQEQVFNRTVARTVAEDITNLGPASFLLPLLNAVTIGAGTAAIVRNEAYIHSLPQKAQENVYAQQVTKRAEQLATNPATFLAAAIFPVGAIIAQGADWVRSNPLGQKEEAPTVDKNALPPPPEQIGITYEEKVASLPTTVKAKIKKVAAKLTGTESSTPIKSGGTGGLGAYASQIK